MWTSLQVILIPLILLLKWPLIFARAFKNPLVCVECQGFFFCRSMLDNCCVYSCCCLKLLLYLFVYLVLFPLLMVVGLALGVLNLAVFIVPAYLVLIYRFTRILFYRCNCCI